MPSQLLVSLLVLFCSETVSGGNECVEGDLKLSGPNEFEGGVEVCLGGVWRRWCAGTGIDTEAINVVCKKLGSNRGLAFSHLHRGSGSNFISNVSCSGEEQSIIACNHSTADLFEECRDVVIVCADNSCGYTFETSETPVRLSNSTSPTEGLLEICYLGYRAGVCYEDIDPHTATLLCRELGFDTDSPGIVADAEARHFWTLTYNCTGSDDISRCSREFSAIKNCSSVRLDCSDVGGKKTLKVFTYQELHIYITELAEVLEKVYEMGITKGSIQKFNEATSPECDQDKKCPS